MYSTQCHIDLHQCCCASQHLICSLHSHRCSLSGKDLNRQWIQPSRSLFPTVYHTKALMAWLQARNKSPFVRPLTVKLLTYMILVPKAFNWLEAILFSSMLHKMSAAQAHTMNYYYARKTSCPFAHRCTVTSMVTRDLRTFLCTAARVPGAQEHRRYEMQCTVCYW